MTIRFDPIRCKKIRFNQTGKSWDSNSNYLHIRRIELLSNEEKYSRGVFKTLIDEREDKDPHKCPVIISAHNFDFNSFHSIDANQNICTFNWENPWFQVELTRGQAILTGFRLKKVEGGKLKSFKVICTDDSNKPEELWTTLIQVNEKKEDEHNLLDIYEFTHPSPLTRFARVVLTGPNWSNESFLMLYHFDLFGKYL